MAPDLDPAAVEAADQAIAALHDRTDLHTRTIEEARKAARAAITAYLDRSGLAEARASLELFRQGMADMEASKDEAVARAEAAERDLNGFRDGLTKALNDAGVPAMPSWPEAIQYVVARAEQAVEARENANALSIRLEGERDRAVERAEAAAADLAVCRQALKKIAGEDFRGNEPNERRIAREALSRLAHSSEEER